MRKLTKNLLFLAIFPATFSLAKPSYNIQDPFSSPKTAIINNGTWAYDKTYSLFGFKAGLWATNINQYNTSAQAGHKLTQVFSYGGDMEMYCQGSGGSSTGTPCTASTMTVSYNPGIQSTAAYYNAANGTSNPVTMTPIVDGVVGGEYLKTFNTLTQAQAAIYADNVAKLYCADDKVSGVQFDLEPFDLSQPGQAFFFTQIAKNFAGQHSPGQPDPYHCVDAAHPKGRTFSVFTYSGKVNSSLGTIFNKYQNGYVIDSLYDLGPNGGGVVNSVTNYTTYVNNEVAKMMSRAASYNVKYQFGIPAAASVHEFESVNGKSTGYKQIDYVKAAINAINSHNSRKDPLFTGINLWGWNQKMFWNGKEFKPSIPSATVLAYLATAL